VCNVAAGARTSLNQLFDAIRAEAGSSVRPRYAPPREGDVRDSLASLERSRDLLGYEPRVALREGLRITIESFSARTA